MEILILILSIPVIGGFLFGYGYLSRSSKNVFPRILVGCFSAIGASLALAAIFFGACLCMNR